MSRPTHSGKTWANLPEQSLRSRMNAGAMNDLETRSSTDLEALANYTEAHADDVAVQALAALTPASNKLPYFNGGSTAALADLTAFVRTIFDDPDAATVRTTLGISIGTNVQAQSTNLQALADLTSAANALPYFTGSGTAALTTLSSFIRTLLDDADAAAVRATLGLIIGTNVQGQDAELQAIAGLVSAADRLPYFTGSGTGALAVFTSFARTLLDDADAASARSTLGLIIGTNVQAQDVELQAIAGLTSSANQLPYFTGSGTAALTSLSSFVRTTLLGLPDASTFLDTIGGQPVNNNLIGIASLTSAADALPYFTGSLGTAAVTTLTSFARTLLDDTTQAAAQTTLGVVPGTNVEAHDADLTALAALSGTGLPARTAANTWALRSIAAGTGLGVTNPAGVAGDPTIAITDAELLALSGLTSGPNALPYFTGSGTAALTNLTSFIRTLLDDTSQATAQATLGLTPGTDVQAYDTELAALAGLTSASNQLPYFTGSGTASLATLTSFMRTLLDDGTQATAQATLGLTPGTDVQAYDAELAALGGLTSAANKLPYFTGAGTASTTTLSAFARTLLDDADSATARATLEVEPGVELGYAEITADATRASTAPADVAGLTVTVTVASRPIIVVFDANAIINTTSSGGVRVDILEDGVAIGRSSQLGATGDASPAHREIRRTPSVGTHTYKIQLATLLSGSASIKADASTIGPAFITVRAV